MKKILCTFFIAFLLCGCAAKNQKGEDQSIGEKLNKPMAPVEATVLDAILDVI